jgi:hypothetical protein
MILLSNYIANLHQRWRQWTQSHKCLYCFESITDERKSATPKIVKPQCPKCNHELPSDFFDASSKVIAIIGSVESGKTIYMTVLTEILRNKNPLKMIGETFSVDIPNDLERQAHNDKVTILYERKETLPATSGRVTKLIVRLKVSTGTKTSETFFLSFQDMVGGDMRLLGSVTTQKQILNADGIICILDPFNIDVLIQTMKQHLPKYAHLRKSRNIDTTQEIINIYDFLREENKVKKNEKIAIPIAFCISKVDLLLDDANIHLPSDMEHSTVSQVQQDIKDTTTHLYDQLTDLSKAHTNINLLAAVNSRFNHFAFFPVSSLGRANKQMDKIHLAVTPQPEGIVHPLFWVLKELNFF